MKCLAMDAAAWTRHWPHYRIGIEINGSEISLMPKHNKSTPESVVRFCWRLGAPQLGLDGIE